MSHSSTETETITLTIEDDIEALVDSDTEPNTKVILDQFHTAIAK